MIFELLGYTFFEVESSVHYMAALIGSSLIILGLIDHFVPGTKIIHPPKRWWWLVVYGLLMVVLGAPMYFLLLVLLIMVLVEQLIRAIFDIFR